MAEQYGLDVEMVKKYLQADQIKDQVISRKAVAVVVDSAEAVKPAKKTTKKKTAKKAEGEAEETPAEQAETEEAPAEKEAE